MGKKAKGFKDYNWKPLQLDSAVFAGGVEGLIGIEECTDYDLNAVLPKNQKRKLKTEHSNALINQELSAKRVKAKKKNKLCTHAEEADLETECSPSKQGSTDNHELSIHSDFTESDKDDCENNLNQVSAWYGFGLPDVLLKAIADEGFIQPTQIQLLTLPPAILGRRDILGAAETGSGKTLAFGLPILSGILKLKEKQENEIYELQNEVESSSSENEENEEDDTMDGIGCVRAINNIEIDKLRIIKPLYALILTPTRELAVQIKNHLTVIAKYSGIKIAVVVGGMAAVKQERILSKGPEIVVATPGRLWELIRQGNMHLSQVDNISFLAIDETDRMMEKGHFQELRDLLERINLDQNKCKQRQNFVFSATLTLVHELPRHLLFKKKVGSKGSKKVTPVTSTQKIQHLIDILGITNPKIVDVTQKSATAASLTECRITCAIDEKDYYVYYFLQKHPGRTLIFCNSIGCVKRLTTLLALLECKPLPLHASMQQRQRLKNLDRFRDDEHGILIATDVAARGLDIPSIEHVLHYQTPRTSESYVHRSGRTARASKQGITILFVEPSELPNYLRLCKTLGKTEDIPTFPVQANLFNGIKLRVNLARELDKLELQVRKANSESGWLQKAAEDMDILIDDVSMKYDIDESRNYKKIADRKRKQLAQLLAKPIFPRGFSGKYPLSSTCSTVPFILNESKTEKAVDIMKKALETTEGKERSKPKWLFKLKQPSGDSNMKSKNKMKTISKKTKRIKKSKNIK